MSHLPSTIYLSMSTFARLRARLLVFDDILSSHPCLFKFACYYHCYTRRSDTPCSICVHSIVVCVCVCVFLLLYSLCTSSVPTWQGVPLAYIVWILVVFYFRDMENLCGLRLGTATHLVSTTSHLRESFNLGKIHFTSLISFRGWFTGVTHIYLSLLIRGISSHGMVGNCWVSFPSVHISHSVGNLEIETRRRPNYLLFLWLFIFPQEWNICHSLED